MDPAEIAALLRATDPAELIDVYPRTVEPFIDVPVVIRDGHVLPEESLEKLLHSSARVARVPLLMGTNRDETRVLQLAAGVEIRSLFGLFPRVKDAERYARLAYYTSGLWKAAGADEIAAAQVRGGARDVWVYRFDWDEQPSTWLGDLPLLMGASHAMEVPFVFGRFELGPLTKLIFDEANEPGRLALSDTMMSYWAQFAATGDPARGRNGSLPRWERWSEATVDAPRFLILDTPASGGPHMSSDSLTQSELLAELMRDPLLPEELRCDLLEQIQNNPTTPKIDLVRTGCADEDRASARTP